MSVNKVASSSHPPGKYDKIFKLQMAITETNLNPPSFDHLNNDFSTLDKVEQADIKESQYGQSTVQVDNNISLDNNTYDLCYYCGKQYKNLEVLNRHIYDLHNSMLPFKCNICGINQLSEKSASLHKKMHQTSNPHPCDQCDKIFFTLKLLQKHMIKDHGNNLYQCDFCENSYKTPASLKAHKESNHRDPTQDLYKCKKCDKSYMTAGTLRSHKSWAHMSVEVLYKCDKCFKTFDNRIKFKKHMRIHEYHKGYTCPICNNWFRCKMLINRHKCSRPDSDIPSNDE